MGEEPDPSALTNGSLNGSGDSTHELPDVPEELRQEMARLKLQLQERDEQLKKAAEVNTQLEQRLATSDCHEEETARMRAEVQKANDLREQMSQELAQTLSERDHLREELGRQATPSSPLKAPSGLPMVSSAPKSLKPGEVVNEAPVPSRPPAPQPTVNAEELQKLKAAQIAAAEREDFPEAARLRDRIKALSAGLPAGTPQQPVAAAPAAPAHPQMGVDQVHALREQQARLQEEKKQAVASDDFKAASRARDELARIEEQLRSLGASGSSGAQRPPQASKPSAAPGVDVERLKKQRQQLEDMKKKAVAADDFPKAAQIRDELAKVDKALRSAGAEASGGAGAAGALGAGSRDSADLMSMLMQGKGGGGAAGSRDSADLLSMLMQGKGGSAADLKSMLMQGKGGDGAGSRSKSSGAAGEQGKVDIEKLREILKHVQDEKGSDTGKKVGKQGKQVGMARQCFLYVTVVAVVLLVLTAFHAGLRQVLLHIGERDEM